MKLVTHQINASDVLSITELPSGRAGVPHLNWEIRPGGSSQRKELPGAGIYGLCHQQRLIYIGSYLGSGSPGAAITGDVVKDRWWTHIGSITGRGSRVHIAGSTLTDLGKKLGSAHPMLQGLKSAIDPVELKKDAGCLAPLRRLIYAATKLGRLFSDHIEPAGVLNEFHFVYVRFDGLPEGVDRFTLKNIIESAEKRLVSSICPPCNSKWVPKSSTALDVPCAEVEELIKLALTQCTDEISGLIEAAEKADDRYEADDEGLEGSAIGSSAENDGSRDREHAFWEQIPADPHYARIVLDSIIGFASRYGLFPYYTATNSGDLRLGVRPLRGGRLRVVMRIFWQPSLERFQMSIFAPSTGKESMANMIDQLGDVDVSSGSKDKIVIKFRPETVKIDRLLGLIGNTINHGRENL